MATQTKAWEPTPTQVAHLLHFSKNSEYYLKNMGHLRKHHGGKFIAVLDGNVILDDKDASRLLDSLVEKYTKAKRSQTYITYVPLEREIRIA